MVGPLLHYPIVTQLNLFTGPVVRIGPSELHFSDHQFCIQFHKGTHLYKCGNYYGILDYLLGGFASPHHHAKRKSIIQPLFAGGTLAEFSTSMLSVHINTLVDRLTVSGSESNATHLLWAYTTDVMMSYIVGMDCGYSKSPDTKAVHDATRAFNAIDLATVLRSMPPVKRMFDWVPSLRRFSPLGWIDEASSRFFTT